MGILIFGGVILLIVIVAVITSLRVVPQQQRLVVHQFGHFRRIAGPGLVLIIPYLHQVVKTIEVRDHPVDITVSGIFAFGISNDLTLNLWYSFNPVAAVGDNYDELVKILQLTDSERHRQIEVKVREALVNKIADLQQENPLPETATVLDGLIALAPGSDIYKKLIAGVKAELLKTLLSLGIVLNTNHPITLTGRGISDDVIKSIKRLQGRQIDSTWLTKYAAKLRQQFPDVSSRAMLAQLLSSIEGVDVGSVQKLFLEKDASIETEFEVGMSGDGSATTNVIATSRTQESGTATPPESVPAQPSRSLTKSDLAVLKRVPRSNQDKRLSA